MVCKFFFFVSQGSIWFGCRHQFESAPFDFARRNTLRIQFLLLRPTDCVWSVVVVRIARTNSPRTTAHRPTGTSPILSSDAVIELTWKFIHFIFVCCFRFFWVKFIVWKRSISLRNSSISDRGRSTWLVTYLFSPFSPLVPIPFSDCWNLWVITKITCQID